MPVWRAPLDEWLRTHSGVVTAPRLRQFGLADSTVQRMCARGELLTLLPGAYVSAQWPVGRQQVMVAVCARNPFAAIGFTSAARLWGFRGVTDRRVHVLVPHGSSPQLDGVVVHRCRRIDVVDLVERPDGIRLTSPPRTLFDAADMLGSSAARSVLEQVLHERLCTIGTVIDTYLRLAHRNRPGTSTMRAVLASRPAWRQALQSDLEVRVLRAIEHAGLPMPIPQCPVTIASGATIHLDFGWPQWKVGLEVDHPAWHEGVDERERDMRRDRGAAAVGWWVVRASRTDVETGLASVVDDVARIILRRSAA